MAKELLFEQRRDMLGIFLGRAERFGSRQQGHNEATLAYIRTGLGVLPRVHLLWRFFSLALTRQSRVNQPT
jgi:hypothetical protein